MSSRRQFDLYAAERRAGHIALILGLALVKYGVLARYRADDLSHAIAQHRGARLIRKMSADGSLKARSPRKVVRLP